jgi:collagenase-like PrtC family protease
VAAFAREWQVNVALTLNVRYTNEQMPFVAQLAATWEEMGGDSIIVADPALMLLLQRKRSRLQIHASLLTNPFNSSTLAFLAGLGVSRVVLPRELSLQESRTLVASARARGLALEFEMLVLNQRCPFIDGLCGFFHAVCLPKDVPAQFDYEVIKGSPFPVVWSSDSASVSHGCELRWKTDAGPIHFNGSTESRGPACAACFLLTLAEAGIFYFKIAGRGVPSPSVARDVSFIRAVMADASGRETNREDLSRNIRQRYAATFCRPCGPLDCYYRSRSSS